MGNKSCALSFYFYEKYMEEDLGYLLISYLFIIGLVNILLFAHSKIPKEKRSYYDLIDKELEYCIVYLSFIPLYNISVVALIIVSLLFNLYSLIKRS
jgi:hypothetical protein